MAENEFEIGSVVELNSGGPRMTISEISNQDDGAIMVTCDWFDKNLNKMREVFDSRVLRPEDPHRVPAT